MTAIYNELDRKAAAWLRELIAHGHIMEGTVDERSIAKLGADDLRGVTRVHFFAGIGGWDYALRLAGWPDDRPVWTGSCPCQPFSIAGRRGAEGDERHLWPEFYRLIAECRPPVVFGEQVASKDGRAWLAGVRADLGSLGYAVGAADLCAAGVGAPHIRQRLYWVADAQDSAREARAGDAVGDREPTAGLPAPCGGGAGGVGDAEEIRRLRGESQGCSPLAISGSERRSIPFWHPADWLPCRDGKSRRVEPGSFPLAHGVPARVGLLRGYGNAIVPQVAAEFVMAYLEARAEVADHLADPGKMVGDPQDC